MDKLLHSYIIQGAVADAPGSWRQGWIATLAGGWPFILLGPLTIWLAYQTPYPAIFASFHFDATFTGLVLASLALGVVIAAWRKFPRWGFPYLGILLILSGLPLLLLISNVLFPGLYNSDSPLSGIFQVGALGFSWLISVTALILLALYWRPVKALGERLRSDWTQLAFGLFILMTWLFGQIDHDEDPYLTAAVILPGILLAIGAIGYMRSQTRLQQWLSLFGSLAAAMLVRIATGAWFYAVFALPLCVVVFLPAIMLVNDQKDLHPTLP